MRLNDYVKVLDFEDIAPFYLYIYIYKLHAYNQSK